MLPDGRRLGAHLPLGHGMVRAVERAAAIGADTLQVFSDNPTAWARRAAPPRELPAFRARMLELGLGPLSIHASYLVNLAGPDDELWQRSVELLASELRVAPTFGARFLNVHVGSHRGAGPVAGSRRVGEAVARALAAADDDGAGAGAPPRADGAAQDLDSPLPGAEPVILVLENSAGSGDGLGVDVPELAAVLDACAVNGADLDRLGFCLDTAHAWGAGHDIDRTEGVDALLAEFDARIGLDRLRMVHLNDSRSDRGSRSDRHEHLGAGLVGVEGLRRVLTHPGLGHVVYYLETPGMDEGLDAVNVARALDIAAGRPLQPLEPHAGRGAHVPGGLAAAGRGRASAGPAEDG